jgi:hypothetical protein
VGVRCDQHDAIARLETGPDKDAGQSLTPFPQLSVGQALVSIDYRKPIGEDTYCPREEGQRGERLDVQIERRSVSLHRSYLSIVNTGHCRDNRGYLTSLSVPRVSALALSALYHRIQRIDRWGQSWLGQPAKAPKRQPSLWRRQPRRSLTRRTVHVSQRLAEPAACVDKI